MSKKCNVKDIINERKNELDYSPLFQSDPKHARSVTPSTPQQQPTVKTPATKMPKTQSLSTHAKPHANDTMTPRYHDTTQPLNHDTVVSHNNDHAFDVVRKAVKQIGKEAATHPSPWKKKIS